jgi:hypothetical protein
MRILLAAFLGLVTGCGSAEQSRGSDGGGGGGDLAGADFAGADLARTGGDGGVGSCLGSSLLGSLGAQQLLVGAAMADATAAAAPFTLRYQYISGQFPDQGAICTSCASNCSTTDPTTGTHTCDNAHGCNWWGCWQYDQDPPGEFGANFVASAQKNKQIPMFTFYTLLQASALTEGPPEVAAVNDAAFLGRYFDNWRLLLQHIGSNVAFVHIEPDFWGYAQMVNADPTQIPAKVTTANATDCASQPNTLVGFARCMIAMVRKYAPNAKVGLHGSGWGTSMDVLLNKSASFDVAGEAQKLGAFLLAAGAGDGDFLVVDASDRDADWYAAQGRMTWWDASNATLPDFHQAFAWATALAEKTQLPIVWWQLPVGNAGQPNNCTSGYKDNRVDYFFAHTDEVAKTHAVGFAFGAGTSCQTTPETDGGNLINKMKAYAAAGGQPLCVP